MSALTYSFVKEHGVLLYQDTDQWVLAHREGVTMSAINEGIRISPCAPTFRLLSASDFDAEVVRFYQREGGQTLADAQGLSDNVDLETAAEAIPENEDLLESEGDAPIIRLINAILSEAIKEGASDIHVETFERRLQVRFRVDGVLREVISPKRALAPMLISRIKVMAKLDIAEKRVPQDGRIVLRISGQDTDVRVSTLPSTHGERIVMRLLSKTAGHLDLSHLGMNDLDRDLLRQLISKPHGIILVTGPTGSGKTTSLYASLGYLNDGKRNIMTVEDPVEYHIEGIGQTQVNQKADMTFARGLRAILRQDPDVVMIGEIRDQETADIAVQASLTGHLVLSTLHTNTAIGAITRLQDMGIEPFLLSSSVVGVVAQRLVRRLCDHCKTPVVADSATKQLMGVDVSEELKLFEPVGCEHCFQQGYRGRLGLYEILTIDQPLQQLIHQHASEQDMESYVRSVRPSLRADGLTKVLAGLTSLEEVLRVSNEDAVPVSRETL
ncbi:type II secretion system protein GspE [Marinomonas piezotolerans]|uniref:Type II secretion system protein E n=1 Tax=Marinomonas piezotolerans TaxID=2213058 RepID=A0A370UA13_9GAMM|nr:type II secretion system ATPase GspE [Marinomonas piezotolerans]RDL44605.1 type II secretion system protein GspE [Marinomonas piezotolerans]